MNSSKNINENINENSNKNSDVKAENSDSISAAAFVMNIVVLVLEICAFVASGKDLNIRCLKFYTEDSNYFSLFACIAMLVATIRVYKGKEDKIPQWVYVMKYISVCCLAVTFTVVVTVLAPFCGPGGYAYMLLKGSSLFKHLLCPVFAFITYVFFEANESVDKKLVKYALIPTAVYAIVSTTLNFLRVLHGPYPFLYVYEQPLYQSALWAAAILLLAYILALVIYRLSRLRIHLTGSGCK